MSTLARHDQLESTSCGTCVATGHAVPAPGALLRRLLDAWQNHRSEREAMDALRRLDDRELRDIGLGRSDIEGAVRGTLQMRGRR